MTWTPLELAANFMTVVCIFLAGRNNVHTWWTGIVACILFMILFFESQLYADVTLQVFFIVTGILGWVGWSKNKLKPELPITKASGKQMSFYVTLAIIVALGYGTLLHFFTNAFAPWIDSTVLTFSVIGQLLLMRRKLQAWPIWVMVNVLSVPLYFYRELYLTSALYFVFLCHAFYAWYHWFDVQDSQQS